MKQNRNSVLVAGVPRSRGKPIHLEHDDDTAFVAFRGDEVLEIHTPRETFARVHEFMHTQHSSEGHSRSCYGRVNNHVAQLSEDCRIHINFWPWAEGRTPDLIRKSTTKFMRKETRQMNEALEEDPKMRGLFPDFIGRLRQAAIKIGLGTNTRSAIKSVDFVDSQQSLARHLLDLLRRGREQQAAETIQQVFFGKLEKPDGPRVRMDDDDEEEIDDEGNANDPPMEIIELDHTIRIPEAKRGKRRATTGPRLHRPSLRKIVLPQRLFVKRARLKPGGSILIDASGSMGSWDRVREWAEKAPFGTIAYYAGGYRGGQLFVYARNGWKAADIVQPDDGGNTIDGPAMDWLMQQSKPRIMVTDREFCGASDSDVQVARLDVLERQGEIEVRNYYNE